MDSPVMYDDHSSIYRDINELNKRVDILSSDLQHVLMLLNAEKSLEVSDHVRRNEFTCLISNPKDCEAIIDLVNRKLGIALNVTEVIDQCPQYKAIPSANRAVVVRHHFLKGLLALIVQESEKSRLYLNHLKVELNFDTQSPQIYATAAYKAQDLGNFANWLRAHIFSASLDGMKEALKGVRTLA